MTTVDGSLILEDWMHKMTNNNKHFVMEEHEDLRTNPL